MRAFSDWLLQVLLSDNLEAVFPNATGEYAPFIEEMWKDTAIQATYNRRNELQMLPRVATYFLDRVRLFSVFSLSLSLSLSLSDIKPPISVFFLSSFLII